MSSAKRSNLLPDVPTIAESGVLGFDYTLWLALWGPAGMPADVVDKINKDVNRALSSPDLAERLTNLGTLPMNMSSAEFTRIRAQGSRRYGARAEGRRHQAAIAFKRAFTLLWRGA